jgi:hypothetical protein
VDIVIIFVPKHNNQQDKFIQPRVKKAGINVLITQSESKKQGCRQINRKTKELARNGDILAIETILKT